MKSLHLCPPHKENDISVLNEAALNINRLNWSESILENVYIIIKILLILVFR